MKTSRLAKESCAKNSWSFIPESPDIAGLVYPEEPAARSRWILQQRGEKNPLDPARPYAWLLEKERSAEGRLIDGLTIFLTNRECPWRCLMCDLWQNTLDESVPDGAVVEQIDHALGKAEKELGGLTKLKQIKLYNAGSFFDEKAIPSSEDNVIAKRLAKFDRVIVECHPALVGERCLRFNDAILGKLEVALGLETVHPDALAKLNKRVSLDDFSGAASLLTANQIDLRSFVLLQPPFIPESESVEWAKRSVNFSIDCGASISCIIPTRTGNRAMDALAKAGQFKEPTLSQLEDAMDATIGIPNHRVFADLWDLERFSKCPTCFDARRARLEEINNSQVPLDRIVCDCCH